MNDPVQAKFVVKKLLMDSSKCSLSKSLFGTKLIIKNCSHFSCEEITESHRHLVHVLLFSKPSLYCCNDALSTAACMASSLLNILCYQFGYQSKSDYMDRALNSYFATFPDESGSESRPGKEAVAAVESALLQQ